MGLIIKRFREHPLDNNNYVVVDEASCEAILIDCSAPDEMITDYIEKQKAVLKYILVTHAHFDHILGVHEIMEKYKIPAYVSQAEFPLLKDMNGWLFQMGYPRVTIPNLTPLPEKLKVGQIPIHVISTAGHTPGGVSYLIENNLFSGDTLFKGTYGRVDIPMSNPQIMRESLARLAKLPDDIIVYPGHGEKTTIGAEKENYI